MTVDELTAKFLDHSLPQREWTHAAHLKVGLWHGLRFDEATALTHLRDRISRYNVAVGMANTDQTGYHETITRFYVMMIARFLATSDRTRPIDDLANDVIDQLGNKQIVLDYWTKDRIFSPIARREWVEPDLKPLRPPDRVPSLA